jgi:hypothetical protein
MGHKQLQYDYSKICQNVNSCVYLQFTTSINALCFCCFEKSLRILERQSNTVGVNSKKVLESFFTADK